VAAVTNVSPASITNGVTPVTATGTTAAALRADLKNVLDNFLSNNIPLAGIVGIMTQSQALAISLMQTSLGTAAFPGLTSQGGSLAGIPIITSENIAATGGSPTDGYPIIFLRARDILLADDGQVTVDVSNQASLQMDSAPTSPPTGDTVPFSLWQHNCVGLRAERFINWGKARSTAVEFIQNAKYAE
jgi:HK97 family phage major capsid protein